MLKFQSILLPYDNIHVLPFAYTNYVYLYNLSQVATVFPIPCLGVVQDRFVHLGHPNPIWDSLDAVYTRAPKTKLSADKLNVGKDQRAHGFFDLCHLFSISPKTTLFKLTE